MKKHKEICMEHRTQGPVYYIEETVLEETMSTNGKKKVLVSYESAVLPLLNVKDLFVASMETEHNTPNNARLVSVCIELSKEYDEIYIMPEIERECSLYFEMFMKALSRSRSLCVYCVSKGQKKKAAIPE